MRHRLQFEENPEKAGAAFLAPEFMAVINQHFDAAAANF